MAARCASISSGVNFVAAELTLGLTAETGSGAGAETGATFGGDSGPEHATTKNVAAIEPVMLLGMFTPGA